MNGLKRVLFLLVVLLQLSPDLMAQEEKTGKARLQLDFGISSSFHYNAPVLFVPCFDGCSPGEQHAKLAPDFEASVYFAISNKSELKFGAGYDAVRYQELTSELILPEPYESIYAFDFLTLSVGYKRSFFSNSKIESYGEYSFIVDFKTSEKGHLYSDHNTVNAVNIANKLDLGVLLTLSSKFAFNVNGFFKTAIAPYNRNKNFPVNYFPYAFGIEAGLSMNL